MDISGEHVPLNGICIKWIKGICFGKGLLLLSYLFRSVCFNNCQNVFSYSLTFGS